MKLLPWYLDGFQFRSNLRPHGASTWFASATERESDKLSVLEVVMKLLVAITSYNVTKLTIDCLQSLSGQIAQHRRHKGYCVREWDGWRCR